MTPQEAPLVSVDNVDRILEQASHLGAEWRGTRFETYRNELSEHTASRPEFVREFRSNEARRRLMFEAGAQISQVVMAARVWKLLDQNRLRSSLKVVFQGPALDAPDDDLPRNTLLELVAAAVLAGRFEPQLTAKAEDVRIKHPEIGQGAVEAKRPLRDKNLLPTLNEIGRQLRSREQIGSRYGVAAIGGDRIARTTSNGDEAETSLEAYKLLGRRAKVIAEQIDGLSSDPACTVVPAAARAIVIVSGAVLVRQPRVILQPLCVVIELPLGSADQRPEVHRAFEAERGPALADMLVDHRVGVRGE